MIEISYCENCGAALSPGVKFCEECGEPVRIGEARLPGLAGMPEQVSPAIRAAAAVQTEPASKPRPVMVMPPEPEPAEQPARAPAWTPKKKRSPRLWIWLGVGLSVLLLCAGGVFFTANRLLPGGLLFPQIAPANPQGLPDKVSAVDGMKLVNVPAGKFTLGFTRTNIDTIQAVCEGCDWLKDPRQFTFDLNAFWIDQTEVTNGMYAQCVNQGACTKPAQVHSNKRSNYYGSAQYANYPVVNVNWKQAADYCKWAGRRLPTEAEWEKAARGTDGRTFPWGNGSNFDCKQANLTHCQDDTEEVGILAAGASPYGALDMEGNVEEWLAGWADPEYWTTAPLSNPQGPVSGDVRAVRGAGWDAERWTAAVPVMNFHKPDYASTFLGFRCAVTAP